MAYTVTMPGWFNRAVTLASRTNRSTSCGAPRRSDRITLMATRRPSSASLAR